MVRHAFLLLLLCVALPLLTYAQFTNNSKVPHYRYVLAAGVGANQLEGDLSDKPVGPSAYVRGGYFIRHGIQAGVEVQGGILRAADGEAIAGIVRRTLNQYYAVILDARVQPYRFFQKDHIRRTEYRHTFGQRILHSAYVGAGLGAMLNQQWNGKRPAGIEDDEPNDHYGKDQSVSLFLSTSLGFEVPLHRLRPFLQDSFIWSVVVNGQANFAFDDEVDGYSGQYPKNTSKDVFGVLSVGVNLRF